MRFVAKKIPRNPPSRKGEAGCVANRHQAVDPSFDKGGLRRIFGCCRIALLVLAAGLSPAASALNVFACEPEWAALAEALGGDEISADAATTAYQDPHRIQARPSLIAKVRRADLVVCTGAELEIGWLPMLLQRGNNPDVQPGTPGYLEASRHVETMGVPDVVDRAQGDIHASGNPHIHTDPRNIAAVADVLVERLAILDSENAAFYEKRHADFMTRWREAIARWERRAAPLEGMRTVAHHKSWVYLNEWLGLEEVAQLEPKPGIQPSIAHLRDLLDLLERKPPKVIIRAPYYDDRPSAWLAERTGVPAVTLPYTVNGSEAADDLFGLFEDTIDKLLDAAGT